MFDYRAPYESQPSVSVDILRVVQLLLMLLHFLHDSVMLFIIYKENI